MGTPEDARRRRRWRLICGEVVAMVIVVVVIVIEARNMTHSISRPSRRIITGSKSAGWWGFSTQSATISARSRFAHERDGRGNERARARIMFSQVGPCCCPQLNHPSIREDATCHYAETPTPTSLPSLEINQLREAKADSLSMMCIEHFTIFLLCHGFLVPFYVSCCTHWIGCWGLNLADAVILVECTPRA
uniref:Uncharacterized protein n=1 Tax=Physcomitrium patens TaxID=3218 RepID=A0A7I4CJY5_PHYPA